MLALKDILTLKETRQSREVNRYIVGFFCLEN